MGNAPGKAPDEEDGQKWGRGQDPTEATAGSFSA